MTEQINTSRLSTGNEVISIPDISTSRAGIEDIGFMYSAFRACIELHGSEEVPLLKPVVEMDGADLFCDGTQYEHLSCWIPCFEVERDGVKARSVVFAPLNRRGFVCVLTIENNSEAPKTLRAGWTGCWKSTFHTANLSKLMAGTKFASMSSWKAGVPIIEYRGHTPLFAMAIMTQDVIPARIHNGHGAKEINSASDESVSAQAGTPIYYELVDQYEVGAHEKKVVPIYVGIGLEEVSAVASAEELKMHGWETMFDGLKTWLDRHTLECEDQKLKHIMNLNSFYNYFYATAITLDTEQLVFTSARSSRNDYCASYWDRDAMRWSLPAVLQVNWAQARNMLIYAFTTQMSNVGVHSRFIDGIVLEPGMQLDQLCSPPRALHKYVEITGDMSILFDRRVQTGINTIQQILAVQRHPDVALFESLLLPSGRPSKYPYVCYSNVFLWRILLDIGSLYERIRDLDRADEAKALAEFVRAAIVKHFIVKGPFGSMFALTVDLDGNYELGDDPAGSLQMLAYYDFCSADDQVYQNTMKWIDSEHNPARCIKGKFAEPAACDGSGASVVSVINNLFVGQVDEALEFLRNVRLDDGIACESVDPDTGEALSGRAYASCAGYLAYGLKMALDVEPLISAGIVQKRRPSETLYQPPPEPSQDTKKARL